eukprot:339357-Chlamydomonas_euryale.AAC.1
MSDSAGVRAAVFLAEQAAIHASLRPLTLVLKTYLKAQRLNDVATGGLSSYSLCNMVCGCWCLGLCSALKLSGRTALIPWPDIRAAAAECALGGVGRPGWSLQPVAGNGQWSVPSPVCCSGQGMVKHASDESTIRRATPLRS